MSSQIAKRPPLTLAAQAEYRQKQVLVAHYLSDYAAIANRAVTPQLLQIYEDALRDIPVNRLQAGLEKWLRDGDRFPWPSDIREAAEL
jgi:hypothetical protein